jgi:transposase
MLDAHDIRFFMQDALLGGMDAAGTPKQTVEELRLGQPRLRLADRSQVGMHFCCIDELVAQDPPVRTIWDAVCQMDLSGFIAPIKATEFTEGRSANDVRVMGGLWLWAAANNVARGRVLARLCERDLSFKWMCGGLSMNYHTLNDFRVAHQDALDGLFTATLGRLVHAGLVDVTRISQDGLRVRASAGTGSFRTRPTLEKCLAEAEAHLADLRKQQDSAGSEGAGNEGAGSQGDESKDAGDQGKALEVALAADRLERVKGALAQMPEVEASKAKRHSKPESAARVSTTDPQARVMKMPNGGFNPAFNVQLASDPDSRAIVGVSVSNSGAVADWRALMNREQAKEIYKQRASTSETINADLRTFRGMSPFAVRGIAKATCVALWSALVYNILGFSSALT